jgi:hypothetical protein
MFGALFPGKDGLFEISHAGIAAGEHFAELIDQRRRRRVNELPGVTKSDDASRALGDCDEVERFRPLDIVKPNPMPEATSAGLGTMAARVAAQTTTGVMRYPDRVG